MNITILYGRGLTLEHQAVEIAADVYEADEVVYVEEISVASLNAVKSQTGCPSEEVLVVTSDDLSDMGFLRSLFSDCQHLNSVQSLTKFNKAYSELFPL